MDCEAIQREELAEKYVHKRLDAAQMDEFETHLLECPKCAKKLELLQAVQTDLAERAQEIRGWTEPKPHFFRWQVVVLAGMVVVVATASMVVRWQKMQTAAITAPPPQANRSVGKTVGQERETNTTGETVKAKGPQTGSSSAEKTQVARANPPEQISGLPINGRNHINFTLTPSQTSRDVAPSVGPVPTNGMKVGGARARGNKVSVDNVDAVDNSVNGVRAATQVAEEKSKPTPASNDSQPKTELTTAQAIELYYLGDVVAPPYTFSGFVPKGKLPGGGNTGAYSSGAVPQNSGRVMFQEAMNLYVDGRYKEAAGYLENAEKLEPNAADVNFYLGICRLLEGHPEESMGPLKNAAAAGNSLYRQSSHYFLAKAYVQGDRLEDAESEFRKAIAVPGRLTVDAKALLARLQALRAEIEKR